MKLPTSIRRFVTYYGRHGFLPTIRRAGVAATRALFANGQVVFSCDLGKPLSAMSALPEPARVEQLRDYGALSAEDLGEIVRFWNPSLAQRNIMDRFKQGASLWLIKVGGRLAGFGWTIQGRTLEPHYFLLGKDDVHLFDFLVFPGFRGRGINPLLVRWILEQLALDCHGRAFIEAAEWNRPQLRSLARTPFQRLGLARKFTFLGHTVVRWKDRAAAERILKDKAEGPSIDATADA
jgi:GNAT superfamily N-acetyltransferase